MPFNKSPETKIVYNFRNTCYRCFNDIEYPLLGDFSYGELLFQTIDGKDFYYVALIDNETFAFVCQYLKDNTQQKIKKLDPQKILALLQINLATKNFQSIILFARFANRNKIISMTT